MSVKVALAAFLLANIAFRCAAAQTPPAPDSFEMTTANMTPSGLTLKIDVLEWSDRSSRATLVAALNADSEPAELSELPTQGYIWVDGSSVGYSIKYAHREEAEEPRRVTLVTDGVLGSRSYEAWQVNGKLLPENAGYSIITLDLSAGLGFLPPAAGIALDEENALIRLQPKAPSDPVFTGVEKQPQPYWARDGRSAQ